jgi:hypothetical protein
VRFASRVSACRRELNSHHAAYPRAGGRQHTGYALLQQVTQGRGGTATNEIASVCPLERPHCVEVSEFQLVRGAAGSSRSSRRFCADGLNTWRATLRQRAAGSSFGSPTGIATPGCIRRCGTLRTARPNPSVKRSANGRPPGPGHRYGVHFPWPGPGVLSSSPAYLKR